MSRTRPFRALLRIAIVAAVAGVAGGRARGVDLAPGGDPPDYPDQDGYFYDTDPGFLSWHGEVLASRTTPWEVRVQSEEAGRELWFSGTLLHQVIREAESGLLAFHYRLTSTGSSGDVTDFEYALASGFGSYSTDVRYDWGDSATAPDLRRSADGNSIQLQRGDTFGHWLIVRTDAPAYAEGGQFTTFLEFLPSDETARSDVATFKPVPEPAAAGTIGVIAAAALLRRRRRPAAVAPLPAAGR